MCGEVAFTVNAQIDAFHLCHCEQCQKTTGSAHAANLFVKPDGVTWIKGQDNIKRYDVPGRHISSVFCASCGSPVPYLSGSGKAMVIPAGSLDSKVEESIHSHIFWDERAAWYDDVPQTDKFKTFPE